MLNYSKIEKLIDEKNFTKTFLAKKLGMSREGFSKSLKDHNFKLSTLEAVSEILGVSPACFFEETKPTQNDLKGCATNDSISVLDENNPNNPKNMNRLIERQDKIITLQDEKIEMLQMKLAAFELGNDISKEVG